MMRTSKFEDDGHQAFKEVLGDLHIKDSKDAIIETIEETFCQQSGGGLEIITTNSTMAGRGSARRRKVEIRRLRKELGVLKRQMRYKNRVYERFSTQIQRLADAVERVVAQSGR